MLDYFKSLESSVLQWGTLAQTRLYEICQAIADQDNL